MGNLFPTFRDNVLASTARLEISKKNETIQIRYLRTSVIASSVTRLRLPLEGNLDDLLFFA
jgi:hypothetical protein